MKDLDDDRAAILAVIERETNAYLRREYTEWERHWLEGPEIRRIHAHAGTGVFVLEGNEIREHMRRLLAEHREPIPVDGVRRENLNIVVSPEMAWVTYDQIGEHTDEMSEMAGIHRELKILQKTNGTWKIACIVVTQQKVDHVTAPLVEVDETARMLWMNDAARDRLPHHPCIGRRGDFLRTTDPSTQEELVQALEWLSEVRGRHTPCAGREPLSLAVALGQDDSGLAHICWAVLQDAKLLVAFDDTDRLEQRLKVARVVYGLSAAQARLARCLVDGSDLSVASTALGISPNTARTHLQRIYDKVGVRSQPALVGRLLSADRRGV